jgi:hypothetical protein
LAPNERQLSLLKTAHDSLLLALIPMIDDAAFDLVLATESVTTNGRRKLTELIEVSTPARGSCHLTSALLNLSTVLKLPSGWITVR